MCGRFSFAVKARIIEDHFDVEVDSSLFIPRYNCAPSQSCAVITNEEPRYLSNLRWGLIPFWAKDASFGNKAINAKAETITEKPSFRTPFRKRRCLIPADSFYEWHKDAKTPYRILMENEQPFAMAGVWDHWKSPQGQEINSFTIITTLANPLIAPIHHRMPVILDPLTYKIWLESDDEAELHKLLQPFPGEKMKKYIIGNGVNRPQNDDASLHLPLQS